MRVFVCSSLILLCACQGGLTLAPHLTRESELGPASAAGRHGVVVDRATVFENQNPSSRDVHWYRMWRASAMLGLGQVDQALALIDQVLAATSAGGAVAPAQSDRLRAFGYDLRARALLAQGKPQEALQDLERSLGLAADLPLMTYGDCDRALMIAARHKQIEDVALQAGDAARAASAREAMTKKLEVWSRCYVERDYPGMRPVEALAAALSGEMKSAPPPLERPVPQPPPSVSAAPPPPPPTPKPVEKTTAKAEATSTADLPTVQAHYAPVDPTPWKGALESSAALAQKHATNVRTDVVIRTDGSHHAVRMRVAIARFDKPDALIPLFRSTVVFFEQARNIRPKVERALITVESGSTTATFLATRSDVLDLFQERTDAAGFIRRLVRVL
jgi:hypothetical protein